MNSLEELQEIKTYCRHTDYAVRGLYFDFNQIEKDLKAFEIIKEHNVDVKKIRLYSSYELYIQDNHTFNQTVDNSVWITKEEFDLLKEALK